MPIEDFFEAVKEACLPGVWSKGVGLSRGKSVILDSGSSTDFDQQEELLFRVIIPDSPVHPRVSLWPKDLDWHCDCGDRNDLCAHIVACTLVLKERPETLSIEKNTDTSQANLVRNQITYEFSRKDGSLFLDRYAQHGEKKTNPYVFAH